MQTEYLKMFPTQDAAMEWMRMKNVATRAATRRRDLFVVVDGPEQDFAVIDLPTAIEMGAPYKWEC